MRAIVLAICLGMLAGCSAPVEIRPEAGPLNGKLTNGSGKAIGNVLLTLQPLDTGHLAPLEVAADGTFKGDLYPGKYAYFVSKSAKGSDQPLKQVDPKYLEADLGRTVDVKPGEELKIVLQ